MSAEQVQPASFESRVGSRRVDLIERMKNGAPQIEYLPASKGMLVRGKRHLMPAPKKDGKSLTTLVHLVDMVSAGATVVVFDRENGSDEYARRLEAIVKARCLDAEQQELLRENLRYYEFPLLRFADGDDLVALCAGVDLVVFDSQRMFLTDLGLEENKPDDFAVFMGAMVDPLFREGIATLILDNTGHSDEKRARGASTKGDLNEVLFTLAQVDPFDLRRKGLARLEITDSRFGTSGRWEMEIGGGVFGSWVRVGSRPGSAAAAAGRFRPKTIMERISVFVEGRGEPVSRTQIVDNVSGKTGWLRVGIDVLIEEGFLRESPGQHNWKSIECVKPYVAKDDPIPDRPEGVTPTPTPTPESGSDPDPDPDPHNKAVSATPTHPDPTATLVPAPDPDPEGVPPTRGTPAGGSGSNGGSESVPADLFAGMKKAAFDLARKGLSEDEMLAEIDTGKWVLTEEQRAELSDVWAEGSEPTLDEEDAA